MEVEGDTPRPAPDTQPSPSPTQGPKRARIQDAMVSSTEDDHTLLLRQRHALAMLHLMQEMHAGRQLCDVRLRVGAKLIPAHRLMLCACSPYFRAMFAGELRESKEDLVTLRDLNGDAVQAIVDFAYSGTVDIDESNVQSLMSVASVLQIDTVRDLCGEFLKTRLHPSNCLGIKSFAEVHGCFDLLEAAVAYVQLNFTKVATHEEFLQLGAKDLIKIIDKDGLNIGKEEEVYLAALRWLKHDLTNRRQSIGDIFEHVRLPLLSWEFLNSCVIEEELLVADERFGKFVDEARRYHGSMFYPGLHWEVSMRTVPRHSCSQAQFIYIIGGEISPSRNTLSSGERYQPAINNWSPLPPMHQSRRGMGLASVENIIFAVGGADSAPLRTVECFDPQTDSWRRVAKMKVARSSVAVTTMGGQLYACGGYDGMRSVKSVEQYDPNLNEWKHIRDMQSERSMAAAVSHAGLLYVVGGYNGASDLNTVESYDPVLREWKRVTPMRTARSMTAAACLHEKIFVVGGCDHNQSLSSVEVYNPTLGTWTLVSPLLNPRSGVGVSVVHHRLYAIGGYDGQDGLDSVECYDEDKDEWTVVTHMQVARRRFGCCS